MGIRGCAPCLGRAETLERVSSGAIRARGGGGRGEIRFPAPFLAAPPDASRVTGLLYHPGVIRSSFELLLGLAEVVLSIWMMWAGLSLLSHLLVGLLTL